MPMPYAHVQITRDGRGRVTLDGRQVPGVRAVDVRHEVGQPPRLIIEVVAAEAPIEYVDQLDPAEEVTDT
ncbi:hypothetical protein [Streptomyces cyaneofuscatus]|uniref:hypothetical protein n=1 Tax=Streptomyces cyaneofuscatus TaxID=66883 RepID=UPI0038126359